MGSGVSRETASSPELEDFRECAALVTRGDYSWETLPDKMQAKMSGIVARLEEQAEPIFPQRGDLEAMYHLACLLADGKGTARDEERAVSLWKAASERDHIPSRFMLGEMYYSNRGIPVVKNGKPYYNEFRAVALWQSCSEKSFAPADRRLADAYRSGVGVIRADEAKAVEYYTRATNQCVAEAWSEIGELYEKGTGGFNKDESKAASRYHFASEHGVADAHYKLGSMYMDGRGVEKDAEKGRLLWEKAVESGLSNAQYHLAILYAHGAQGFPKDPFKALGLLNHAAAKGHTKAIEQIEIIRTGGVAFKDDEILPPSKSQKLRSKFMVGAAKAMRERPSAVETPLMPTKAGYNVMPTSESQTRGIDQESQSIPIKSYDIEDRQVSFGEPLSPTSPMSPTKSSAIRRQRTADIMIIPITPSRASPKTPKTPNGIAKRMQEEMGKENYSNMLRNKITERRLAAEAAANLRRQLERKHQQNDINNGSEKGILTKSQMRAAFDEVDTDGSNEIDGEELVAAMAKMDPNAPTVTVEAAVDMINTFNGNKSGVLSFESFVQMMTTT